MPICKAPFAGKVTCPWVLVIEVQASWAVTVLPTMVYYKVLRVRTKIKAERVARVDLRAALEQSLEEAEGWGCEVLRGEQAGSGVSRCIPGWQGGRVPGDGSVGSRDSGLRG